MAAKKSSGSGQQPDMLEQKTFEDFNKKKPSVSDPNERKGKPDPESPNLADQAKDPMTDEQKEAVKPTPKVPRKRSTRATKQRGV